MTAEHHKQVDPADGAALARLAHEAGVLTELTHPDVVELVAWEPAIGRLRTASAGRRTLADTDPLDAAAVAGILGTLVRTLAEIHEAGWVHRRVRPDHVIVGPGGRLTLCSFGAAERRSPGHRSMLADHHDLATTGHVLLERARPPVDRREVRARGRLGRVLDEVARADDLPEVRTAWSRLDGSPPVRGAGRLLVLSLVGAAGAAGLWWAGERLGPTAPPPAAAAAVTAIRWAAVAALAYLSIVAGTAGVAITAHATELAAIVLRAAPRPLRRLLGGLVGVGLLSLLAPRAPVPAAPADPTTASVAPTPAPTAAPPPTTAIPATTAAPPPTTASPPTPTPTPMPAPAAPAAPGTATLGPGDHLWAVAERTLAERLGRMPSEREVGRYWARLVELNRAHLADPTNPDLVFVGQVVELPD